MKRDIKYLKAAEVICTNIHSRSVDFKVKIASRSCCGALWYVNKSATRFNELFTPDGRTSNEFYFDNENGPDKLATLARSLALILMYEMGEK